MKCKGRGHIYLDGRLRGMRWLFTAFHELMHAILHSPPSVTVVFFSCKFKPDSKEDREAELLASICLLPEPLLRKMLKENADELRAVEMIDEDGVVTEAATA